MRSRVNLQIKKSTGDPPHLKSLEQMRWGGQKKGLNCDRFIIIIIIIHCSRKRSVLGQLSVAPDVQNETPMRVIAASPSAEVETDQNTISGTCDYLGSTPTVDLPVDSQWKQNEKTTTTATPQWVALAKYEPCCFIYFYPVVIHLIHNSLLY